MIVSECSSGLEIVILLTEALDSKLRDSLGHSLRGRVSISGRIGGN